MPSSKEVDVLHYRSRMVYLDVRPLARELGLSVYAARVLHIIAVHTYENSPVSVSSIVKLWEMDEESVRDAVSEFTLWNGYVSFAAGGKLLANFDALTSPAWSHHWSILTSDNPIPLLEKYGLHPVGDSSYRVKD